MPELNAKDKAPSFTLMNQDGKAVSLADFKGKKVLLYFYPKANTPGCTTQACAVNEALPELTEKGVVAVGVSPDEPKAQKKFDEKFSLGFALLSDPDHAVAGAYGVWGEKVFCGRTCEGIVRSSFLIDEKGKIARAWYKVSPKDTVPEAMKALGPSDPAPAAAPAPKRCGCRKRCGE